MYCKMGAVFEAHTAGWASVVIVDDRHSGTGNGKMCVYTLSICTGHKILSNLTVTGCQKCVAIPAILMWRSVV
jgi:hypothetical protein